MTNMAIGTAQYFTNQNEAYFDPQTQQTNPIGQKLKSSRIEEYDDYCEAVVSWKHLKRVKNLNEKGGGKSMNRIPRLFRYMWYALPLIPLYYIAFHLQPITDFIIRVFILHK